MNELIRKALRTYGLIACVFGHHFIVEKLPEYDLCGKCGIVEGWRS